MRFAVLPLELHRCNQTCQQARPDRPAGELSGAPSDRSAQRAGQPRRYTVPQLTHWLELVELGTLTAQAASFLGASAVSGLNIIVAGGTQAGNPVDR